MQIIINVQMRPFETAGTFKWCLQSLKDPLM